METISPDSLSYPIGKFSFNSNADKKEIKQWISEIEKFPIWIKEAVEELYEQQLNTPYRDGGWTIKQVVHHLADSHMNAYIRVKLALTEDRPTIKPYDEKQWAEMDDAKNLPVEYSLSILESLHPRWVYVLKNISENDLERVVFHPARGKEMSVKYIIAQYAWHGKHHCAHITELRKRHNW